MLELGTWMVLGLGAWLERDARTRNMDGARTSGHDWRGMLELGTWMVLGLGA